MKKIISPEVLRQLKKAKPYIIQIQNTAAETQNFTFFGFNRFQDVFNYGSGAAVTYSIIGGIPYAELLAQSQRPFKVNYWLFRSDSEVNMAQVLRIYYADANEHILEDTIDLATFFDMYASTNNLVPIEYPAYIDGSFYMTGNILGGTTIKVLVYPKTIVNPANIFKTDEGDIVEHFKDKRIISPMLYKLNKLKDGK